MSNIGERRRDRNRNLYKQITSTVETSGSKKRSTINNGKRMISSDARMDLNTKNIHRGDRLHTNLQGSRLRSNKGSVDRGN